MSTQSTIKKLPPEIKDKIGALMDQGRTLDEIVAHLSTLDVTVSRSALGRYKQGIDKVSERIRRSREIAEAMVRNYGQAPESKMARLNIELMHSVLFDLLSQLPDGTETNADGTETSDDDTPVALQLSPREAMEFAKAMDHLARASKQDADLVDKLRSEAMKEAAKATDAVAKKAGLSDDARAEIRMLLGVPA